ncbi:MAG: hypothetical protein A4E35_00923 [Methanoregula sp. PtaU1.Bin051]|nr:MAG: hypothetical protein A4E35_00923 [Methanoregula sp. PtaU1.Bin051]
MNENLLKETPKKAGRARLPAPAAGDTGRLPAGTTDIPDNLPAPSSAHPRKRNGVKVPDRNAPLLSRDGLYIIRRNGEYHVVAESYFYKTEPYYAILSLEYEGKPVRPSSSAVLDAYVIPICLEQAKAAGIPVCEWGISQAYVPLPAVLYGLNYFASNAEYEIVTDNESAKETIRHITNNGKYPFCFQKFPENSEICSCTAVFGTAVGACSRVASYAEALYKIFSIPLMRMVFVRTGDSYALSSLSPVRYSELTEEERGLLSANLAPQESP